MIDREIEELQNLEDFLYGIARDLSVFLKQKEKIEDTLKVCINRLKTAQYQIEQAIEMLKEIRRKLDF